LQQNKETEMTPSPPASARSDTLDAWLAQEQQVRARLDTGVGCGVATAAQVHGKSGQEIMQAMLDGALPYPPIARTLGFTIIEVGPGTAVFQGTPQFVHYNPLGSVHGGWFATLLDSALGCAVHTMMPPGRGYTTAELHVNLVRAITDKVPRVRAEGRVIHCGRQLATAEARLVGPDGTLYAHGSTTCLVFEIPKPAAR
jgi:uncharacterized protein (TIGR00369 family)